MKEVYIGVGAFAAGFAAGRLTVTRMAGEVVPAGVVGITVRGKIRSLVTSRDGVSKPTPLQAADTVVLEVGPESRILGRVVMVNSTILVVERARVIQAGRQSLAGPRNITITYTGDISITADREIQWYALTQPARKFAASGPLALA